MLAATFLNALTVLRSVHNPIGDGPGFVPQLATGAAYVGVLAGVAFFLAFIHHITTSIQVPHVVRRTPHGSVLAQVWADDEPEDVDALQAGSLPQYDGALADARREIARWEQTS